MCLSCMYYIDNCTEPECVERIKGLIEEFKKTGKRVDWLGTWAFTIVEEYYNSRSGTEFYLWTGKSEPCEHIKARHGSECTVFDPRDRDCNCWIDEGSWKYD